MVELMVDGEWRSAFGAHRDVVAASARWETRRTPFADGWAGTLRRAKVGDNFIAAFRAGAGLQLQKRDARSAVPSICGFRDVPIRKKVIGHSGDVRRLLFGACRDVSAARGAFALLQKQPGHGGAGLIGHPLVHQRANLLAQIGGIGEARQFKGLQRSFRGRQQKIPRRLVQAAGHGDLRSWLRKRLP